MLVVCHGNVCRSPLAAAVVSARLGAGRVRSRALKDYGARRTYPPAARKVREWAASRGYDLSTHRAAPLADEDLAWADVVLYMDGGNRDRLLPRLGPGTARGVCLARYGGLDRLADPNFTPRGPGLDRLLGLVVACSEAFCRGETKNPRPGAGG